MPQIFLSWSGEKSHACAKALRIFLRGMYPSYEPWISSRTIGKGEAWFSGILAGLQTAKTGLFCLTAANYREPWVLFEAGALSTKAKGVKAILFGGLTPSDVEGTPFAHLQLTTFGRDEMFRIAEEINELMGLFQLDSGALKTKFRKHWKRLQTEVQNALDAPEPAPISPFKNTDEKLDALLHYVRYVSRQVTERFQENTTTSVTVKLSRLLHSPLRELGLSKEIIVKLKRANITKIGELSQKTSDELSKYIGITTGDIDSMHVALGKVGLGLGYGFSAKVWSASE